MKKLTALFSIFLMSFVLFTQDIYAESNIMSQKEHLGWKVQTIDAIPEGVVPIVINDNEELDEFLSFFEENNLQENALQKNNWVLKDQQIAPFGSGEYTVPFKTSRRTNITGTLNLFADIELYHYNNFRKITGARNTYTTFTGINPGITWEEANTSYQILNGGRSIRVRANGVFNGYFVIDGLFKLYTQNYTIEGTYSCY